MNKINFLLKEIEFNIGFNCPQCGWGLPGPHDTSCSFSAAIQALKQEILKMRRVAIKRNKFVVAMNKRHKKIKMKDRRKKRPNDKKNHWSKDEQ